MLLHLLPAICAPVLGAVGCQQDRATGVQSARPQADVAPARDTTLTPIGDTYIRQGSPNQNQGAELILRLQSSGKNRALLRWDPQALVQAVGSGTVSSARLELTITDLGDNWSTAGRTIDLYRLTHDWTELGATWNCAVDSVPGNPHPDCSGATAWDMDHSGSYPWVATPTARALLKNGQTGVVTFDVTADVLAWLGGQPNDGWILKKTAEGDPGKVDFGSRESATPPHLVLSLLADTAAPAIPDTAYWPSGDDTLRTVPDRQFPDIVYFRDLFEVSFMDSASGATINGFMARNRAVILGGSRWLRDYTIRVPDPGPGQDAFDSLVARLNKEPGVEYAAPITRRGGDIKEGARYPSDRAPLTSRPRTPVIQGATWPLLVTTYPRLDASRLVHSPGDTNLIYFRTDIALRFRAGVTDSAKIVFFTRHSMTVVGVTTNGQFFVRIPDPGPSLQKFYDVIDRLRADPEIHLVIPIEYAGMREVGSASDLTPPPIPRTSHPDDSLYLVREPTDTVPIYYRRLFDVVFSDSTSGTAIRAFVAKYRAQIVSGIPLIHAYTVLTRDPGPGWEAFQARLAAMRAEPGVTLVSPVKRRDYPVYLY